MSSVAPRATRVLEGCRILVIAPHPVDCAPGQRLKYEQYFDDWRRCGCRLVVSPFMAEGMQRIVYERGFVLKKVAWTVAGYLRRLVDVLRAPRYDVVYIFLWATPFGPPLFERAFRRVSKRMVYDIDDAIFLEHESSANSAVKIVKGRRKPLYLMRAADHVITCTQYLDDVAQQFNTKTTDISSTINCATYTPVNPYTNERPVTIGWSGSHSTSKYLLLLSDVFRELSTTYPNVRFLAIGDPRLTIPGLPLESVAWKRGTEVGDLQRLDIGVYPLPTDDWVLGKSGLKALQYMALGIPTVATAIGSNFRIIEHKKSGFLVRSHDEWVAALSRLVEDPDLRRRIGEEGRDRVVQRFSVQATAPVYRDVLASVMSLCPRPRARTLRRGR